MRQPSKEGVTEAIALVVELLTRVEQIDEPGSSEHREFADRIWGLDSEQMGQILQIMAVMYAASCKNLADAHGVTTAEVIQHIGIANQSAW